MKILAVYGSNHGQAEAVLRRVASVLEGARLMRMAQGGVWL